MKYILLIMIASLLGACAKQEVTYIERRKPTAEEIQTQTPAALDRAKVLMLWANDRLPAVSFDVAKKDVATLLADKKGQFMQALDLELEYEYDPDCDAGTMAYVTHHDIRGGYKAKMTFCDYFYNRPLNDQAQTVLHELAHVVAGSGECRAMLYEFWVSYLALGSYTPNDYYWDKKRCASRGFDVYLPGAGSIVPSIND